MNINFFNLLFEPNESTCFAQDKYGVDIYSIEQGLKLNARFFSINALHTSRKDSNVTCFRSFLLEFDKGSQEQHFDLMKAVPWSTAVCSGGKSTHFIIALEQPLYNAEEYREVVYRLHKAVPQADSSTKNPSRLSRLPNVLRPDTGRLQSLLDLRSRVSFAELNKHLPSLDSDDLVPSQVHQIDLRRLIQSCVLDPNQAIERFNLAGRNAFFYWLGMRLKEASVSKQRELVELAYSNLRHKQNFNLQEALKAARLDKS